MLKKLWWEIGNFINIVKQFIIISVVETVVPSFYAALICKRLYFPLYVRLDAWKENTFCVDVSEPFLQKHNRVGRWNHDD